jgi:DNA polymerase-1
VPEDFYKGANAQIQGGAADLMSIALLRADQVLTKQGWGHIISIIHDEALFEIKEQYVEEAIPILARVMEVEDIFDLPFATDAKVGNSYGSMEKYPLPTDLSDVNWRDYI